MKKLFALVLISIFLLSGCSDLNDQINYVGSDWQVGFSEAEIAHPENGKKYIAGYKNGVEITGINDLQKVKAVWLDCKGGGVLIISVDCIGLTSEHIGIIRQKLESSLPKNTSINIVSTHDHAGLDTMGLWGEIGMDGKNPDFMEELISCAVSVGKKAFENRSSGRLSYQSIETEGLLRDSREPNVYDSALRQFRFVSDDNKTLRIVIFSAHAESLRGANTLLSADFPGELARIVKEKTGDDMIFLNGAIGGLIMTREFTNSDDGFNALENLRITGEKLAEYLLSMDEKNDIEIQPSLAFATSSFKVRLDNTLFIYYKFLGILGTNVSRAPFSSKYYVKSEVSVIRLGNKTLALIPGEIFPELISGTGDMTDPKPLSNIHSEYFEDSELIPIGLANDELGYIIPPSDYLLDEKTPYFKEARDEYGNSHYEETNSVGIECAEKIAEAFENALKKLK